MNNILILDYKIGNVNSVIKAVKYLGYDPIFSNNKKDIHKCNKLILPGQGSFDFAMEQINKLGLKDLILNEIQRGKKILGICLGMQILASYGFENNKKTEGLNLIPGEVIKFRKKNLKLPNIGWREVKYKKKDEIFKSIKNRSDFYHCHSYIFNSFDNNNVIGTSTYGSEIYASIIKKKNIYGVQFHPEKSLKLGIKLIENFLKIE